MEQDPNDILYSNQYIQTPNLNPNISQESSEEFKRYYENEIKKQEDERLAKRLSASVKLTDMTVSEDDDTGSILNSNRFTTEVPNQVEFKRYKRQQITTVNVDSRDRDKLIYTKPNNFKIFLGKTYYNVQSIKLTRIEFPNTNAVINSTNNRIYWRNQEDIDLDFITSNDNVITYPVYSVQLRIGSYISSSLASEIMNKMNIVRRTQGSSSLSSTVVRYHYFIVSMDIDTDIVTFTSLTLNQLPNNPLSTTIGSNVIIVNAPNHGYVDNELIYISGAKTTAGLSATTLSGFHMITYINSATFSFEVNEDATDTVVSGGGNSIKTGKKTPFQLLWGESENTVAQNIGYPLENSFEQIFTNIIDLENINQMSITLTTPHNFNLTYDYIGQIINIGYMSGPTFMLYKSYVITNIMSTNTILVQVVTKLEADNLTGNSSATTMQFTLPNSNIVLFDVDSYTSYINNCFIITTETPHNYTLNDISNEITLYNTADTTVINDTSYDGVYKIFSVPSSTTIIVPGALNAINIHPSGIYGNIPRHIPLTTHTAPIQQIIIQYLGNPLLTKVICNIPHRLLTGDSVYLYNVIANPIITKSFAITKIDDYSFTINFQFSSIDQININNGTAFVGTGLMEISFPKHTFNVISNISVVSGTTVQIQTINDHNLTTGTIVRLSGTNTTPKIDKGYTITVTGPDTFNIVTSSPLINIPNPVTGIIGLSNDFYLYSVQSIGGITETLINNVLLSIRDIIDENTFTFIVPNAFATSTEKGGGSNVFISSLKHGFAGIQTNTKNNLLNRSINLEGENYCFLVCPQLSTMKNTGNVSNIFARISLNQSPGYVCFDFLSNPKIFDTVPLSMLSELEFSVVNYDGTLYDFNDLDFSFALDITGVIDQTDAFNISSKRGIYDVSDKIV
jgi:hypothetical protein